MMPDRRLVLAGLALMPAAARAAAAPIGQVVATKGSVFRERAGHREPASRGTLLEAADACVTGPGGKARLQLNDGTLISVGENARVQLAQYQSVENGYTTRINAEAGAMRFLFLRSLDFSRFEVETETAVAAVRGTAWIMDVRPGHTAVALLEGRVAVRGTIGGAEVILDEAGQGTDVRSGAAPTPPVRWGAQRFQSTLARASFED
jgi:hypothetical protein